MPSKKFINLLLCKEDYKETMRCIKGLSEYFLRRAEINGKKINDIMRL